MKDLRVLKIMFNKSKGADSKNSYSPKVSIPKVWLDDMNITPEDREVKVTYEGKKIIIEKKEEE